MESFRAHLEWQADSGASGLPRDPDAKRRVKESLDALDWSRPAASSSAGPVPATTEPTHEDHGPAPAAPPAATARRAAPQSAAAQPAGTRPAAPVSSPTPRARSRRDPERISLELAGLQTTVSTCTSCRLHETRTQTVFARGSGTSGLCFVGEGPGADEDARGEPFVGKAGQLLDKMIAAMGFDRDDVYVCNIVKCRPPGNRKPEADEMHACSGYLSRQLEIIDPQVIVALGATALEGLTGRTGIRRLRGKFCLYQGRIAVMPTFHPAYLLRTPAAKREVWDDLRQVVQHMGRELP